MKTINKQKYIILGLVLLLIVICLFIRNNSLFLGSSNSQTQVPAIQSITNTPTPTLGPTVEPEKNNVPTKIIQPTATLVPQPSGVQKTSIVLSHDGNTYNCDSSMIKTIGIASAQVKALTDMKCSSVNQQACDKELLDGKNRLNDLLEKYCK